MAVFLLMDMVPEEISDDAAGPLDPSEEGVASTDVWAGQRKRKGAAVVPVDPIQEEERYTFRLDLILNREPYCFN